MGLSEACIQKKPGERLLDRETPLPVALAVYTGYSGAAGCAQGRFGPKGMLVIGLLEGHMGSRVPYGTLLTDKTFS